MSSGDRLRKAQIVRDNVEKLARIPQADAGEFTGDFRNVEAALHLLRRRSKR